MFTAQRKNSVRFTSIQAELKERLHQLQRPVLTSTHTQHHHPTPTSDPSAAAAEAETEEEKSADTDRHTACMRRQIVHEIWQTEERYVRFLEVLWFVYKWSLVDEGGATIIAADDPRQAGSSSSSGDMDDFLPHLHHHHHHHHHHHYCGSVAVAVAENDDDHHHHHRHGIGISNGDADVDGGGGGTDDRGQRRTAAAQRTRTRTRRRKTTALPMQRRATASHHSNMRPTAPSSSPPLLRSSRSFVAEMGALGINVRTAAALAAPASRGSITERLSAMIGRDRLTAARPLMLFPLNLQQIMLFHQSFLAKVRQMLRGASVELVHNRNGCDVAHVEEIPFHFPMGQIVNDHFATEHFRRLYLEYLSTFEDSLASFRKLRAENARVAAWHDRMKKSPATCQQDIPSLLIMVVQRTPRYMLLLSQLLKYTPEWHADYDALQEALEVMSNAAEKQNKNLMSTKIKRAAVSSRNFHAVSLDASISCKMEGELWKEGHVRRSWKMRRFFLFQTHLQYHDITRDGEVGRCKGTIPLQGDDCHVLPSNAEQHGFDTGFLVITAHRTFFMRAKSEEEVDQWILAIARVIADNRAKKTGASTMQSALQDSTILERIATGLVTAEPQSEVAVDHDTDEQQQQQQQQREQMTVELNEFIVMKLGNVSSKDCPDAFLDIRLCISQSIVDGKFLLCEQRIMEHGPPLKADTVNPINTIRFSDVEKLVRTVEEDKQGDQLFYMTISHIPENEHCYYFGSEADLDECFSFLQQLHRQQGDTDTIESSQHQDH